ncbi:MAG: hypothetical protein M1541_16390 [Acidobacteria bacterium]|nr:hypothetical protein [Acidobacteriota bacterium]
MKKTLKTYASLLGLVFCCCSASAQNPSAARQLSLNRLEQEFASPPAEYRGKPFWSWNGDLKQEELIRQIHVLKDMGMGGFFMHSRTGLKTEYLGNEWFRLINASADEAARLGIEAWLYDEDRWPSGSAGGLVTRNPQYRMKTLTIEQVPMKDFHWRPDALAAFACDISGTAFTTCTRLTASISLPARASQTVLVFSVREMDSSSFYNGYTYLDTLKREATDAFLKTTHEQYKAHSGARLGTSIKGIFTDEPHRGMILSDFVSGGTPTTERLPWTESIPARFRQRFGYDLLDRLPEVVFYKNGEPVSQVKWQFVELLQEMFLDNFAKPIHEWCRANNMLFTGHVLQEDSLTAQTVPQGSLMRFYEQMDYPGVDVLTEFNRNYWVVKQLSSAARQAGQKWLLSELYGVSGWQMNFASHKYVGDWQALFGINLRCHHLAWYTMAGEAKRDYPASISFQSAWWKDYKYVEDYYSRLNLMLAQGEPARDVLVLNPVESVWCQIGLGYCDRLSANTPVLKALERAYVEVFNWLAGAHVDFDYGDEEMLGRLYKVERDAVGAPLLRFGAATYRVVVVPKMTTIRSSTLKALDEFRRAGGTVVFAGDPPQFVDAVKSPAAAELAGRARRVPWSGDALVAACNGAVRIPVEIVDRATGKPAAEIFCQLRQDGNRRILAAISMNRDKWFKNVLIRVKAPGYLTEWDCRSGRQYTLPAAAKSGWTEWTAEFPPIGEHVYVLNAQPEKGLSARPVLREVSRRPIAGPFDYKLSEPNVCVLDLARYRIDNGDWKPETEVLKLDQAVRAAFKLPARGGIMVQPWFSRKFETKPEVKGQLAMAFEFFVDDLPRAVELGIERPGEFQITLNGRPVSSSADKGWWVDPAIRRIALPAAALAKGRNTLELRAGFRKDLDIEAVYLLGQFGVRVNGTQKTLIRLPEKMAPADLVAQGLPFYSGTITYHVPLSARPGAGRRFFIETPKFEGACVKVSAGKSAPAMIAFQPYRAEIPSAASASATVDLEVVMTRRNSFGPLHQLPVRARAYGPSAWVSEGKAWSQPYLFYPSGLLAPPELTLYASEPE